MHLHLMDRPLAGSPHPDRKLHLSLYGCEAVSMTIMMFCGVAAIVALMSSHSPLAHRLADYPNLRVALCGISFGLASTLAAHTPFGKVSGAHVNPSMTLAFLLGGRLVWIDALGYVLAQIIGAFAGVFLVACIGFAIHDWNGWTTSVFYGATIPASSLPIFIPLGVEFGLTFLLVGFLYYLASHDRLHWLTPWAAALFFAVFNPLTAWLSGNSLNVARSLAPAVLSSSWSGFWIYIVGPFAGSAFATACIRFSLPHRLHLMEARLINFGHHGRVPSLKDPEAGRVQKPNTAPSGSEPKEG